nr:MAG TPA: hypothetical protein [Caudoviricetes sp.]
MYSLKSQRKNLSSVHFVDYFRSLTRVFQQFSPPLK